jgi:oligopeptidase B
MPGLFTRRHFTFGLAAAAIPLASRLPFGQANTVETAAHAAPIAPIVPKRFTAFGGVRIDNYDWLRDRRDPRVVAYLNAENAYADARLEPIKPLVEQLAAELKAREAQEDASVPTAYNGYLYERRFSQGAQYPYVVRRKDEHGAQEEIVLNVGELAAGHQQYQLGSWNVSPDNEHVAFSVDFTGGREFRIFVRTIATGETVDQGIDNASSDVVFAADNNTLFYIRNEQPTVRAYQVWRHRLGSNPKNDALIYEESDPTFDLSIALSGSRKFILLNISEERTSEFRYLPANQPTGELKIIEPRRQGVIYEVDHVGDNFYIRTNLDAPDFRLIRAPQATPMAPYWKEIVPEQPGHHLSHFKAFETFVAVDVENESGTTIRVFSLPELHEIPVPRPAAIGVASSSFVDDNEANFDPAANVLRFHFSSPVKAQCVYDFDVTTSALTLRKQDQASRWFDPNDYVLDELSATAPDGERVPVTIVYRKDMRRAEEGNPTLIVGYGAYGLSSHATFTRSAFSLIDRGFVYAIAHVRGGHEKGERWYAEGRMLNKRNTFTDFIAVTETLIAKGYGDPRAIFAQGGSAGGLLMGAIANLRPDLYAGIIAEVPFVDVVTTMSDASVPLTTLEYDEWGNPAVKREYDYMLSYSPYDNVGQRSYPAMFVTAGFYDSQVSFAEPAKWVAKLRASKTDTHDLLFKTDLAAGHGGRSGRLGSIKQDAETAAWLIAHAGRRVDGR